MRFALLLAFLPAIALAAEPDLTERLLPLSPLELRDQRVRHAFVLLRTPEANTLEQKRELDRRFVFGSQDSPNLYAGVALFGAAVFAAAHAPAPLRRLFDRDWHLGPAVLDGGGMGAGFGGRW